MPGSSRRSRTTAPPGSAAGRGRPTTRCILTTRDASPVTRTDAWKHAPRPGSGDPSRYADGRMTALATRRRRQRGGAMAHVHGIVESGFEGVRDTLAANLDSGADVGASVAVLVDGETVVDIW